MPERSNRLAYWIARHLPDRVVYWAVIRAWTHATTGPYGSTVVPDVTASLIVNRWGRDHGMPGHGGDHART